MITRLAKSSSRQVTLCVGYSTHVGLIPVLALVLKCGRNELPAPRERHAWTRPLALSPHLRAESSFESNKNPSTGLEGSVSKDG
mmetsp:Transcript_11264/g.22677  ORF Transcript_11264/g.22677 Transcript_11264/m.22677 type:complete len:84 (-) Transcript_11264:2747-2998(-)